MPGLTGVLLMGFGAPDSLDSVEPFVNNLLGGRPASPAMLAAIRERYEQIGGRSPFPEIALAQARALEDRLNEGGGLFRVYVGMHHWHPFIRDAVATMVRDGVERAVAISLSAHDSRVTTDAFIRHVQETLVLLGRELPVLFARGWHVHPAYLAALEDKLAEGLDAFPARRSDMPVVFTAHNLPAEFVRGGDPYADQLRATAEALAARSGIRSWRLAFQSKSAGYGEWLSPTVEEVLEELAAAGGREVLVDPIGFVADHLETLYDIDIALRQHAEVLGLRFARCACLNDSPRFVAALADIVRSQAGGALR